MYLYRTTTRCVSLYVSNAIFSVHSTLQTQSWGPNLLIILWKALGQWQVRKYSMDRGTLDRNGLSGECTYYIARRWETKSNQKETRRYQDTKGIIDHGSSLLISTTHQASSTVLNSCSATKTYRPGLCDVQSSTVSAGGRSPADCKQFLPWLLSLPVVQSSEQSGYILLSTLYNSKDFSISVILHFLILTDSRFIRRFLSHLATISLCAAPTECPKLIFRPRRSQTVIDNKYPGTFYVF